MSDQNWRPGQPLPIDTTVVNPYKTHTHLPNSEGGGYDRTGRTRNRSRTGSDLFSELSKQDIEDINQAVLISQTVQNIEASKPAIAHEHQIKSSQIATHLQLDINTVTANLGGLHGLSPVAAINRQLTALNHLIHAKTSERNHNQARANAFYGGDPLVRTQRDLVDSYLRIPASEVLHRWTDSYTAAYTVHRNAEQIRQLTDRLHQLSAQLPQAHAQEDAQRLARLKAEAEAQAQHAFRVAAEAAQAKAQIEHAARAASQQAELAERKAAAEIAAQKTARIEQEKAEAEKKAEENRVLSEQAKKLKKEKQKKQKNVKNKIDLFDLQLKFSDQTRPIETDGKNPWLKEKHQRLLFLHQLSKKAHEATGSSRKKIQISRQENVLRNLEIEIDQMDQQTRATENARFKHSEGSQAIIRPLLATPEGLIAGYENLQFSLSGALDLLKKSAKTLSRSPLVTLVESVFHSPSLGNGELQRHPVALTIPLAQLAPNSEQPIAVGRGKISTLPFRVVSTFSENHTQLFLSRTGDDLSPKVRNRKATYNPDWNLYTFTTEGLDPRTLTWTPNHAPGSDGLGSIELPVSQSEIKIYPGARITPLEGRHDEHPTCDERDSDDYILTFPPESGIDRIYVMVSRAGARFEPGTVTGRGQNVGENWLDTAAGSEGAPVPTQIADRLRGQDFRNFDSFRDPFWKSVATDPVLSQQFGKVDLEQMRYGAAPFSEPLDSVGGREKIELHHKQRIADGGAVYDLENLSILTPKAHIELHKKGTQQ
jgi:hypothetical protein